MQTYRFKTNARCAGCAAKIYEALDSVVPRDRRSLDLSSPLRILTVLTDCPAEEIVRRVNEAGFMAERVD